MSDTCYVEKERYDMLFAAYAKAESQLADLKKAWNDLRSKTAQFDDRVLDDIHRFGSLEEESAYLIGSFNTMLAFKYDMEELEETFNAENRK